MVNKICIYVQIQHALTSLLMKRRALIVQVLSFKLNVGNFPHLADLVTRINHNYYYISDSGNPKMSLVPKLSHYDRERSL